MRQQPFNQQAITQYLLGTLSQAETEQFDELSFTDEHFVEALNSTENDLIDAYVNGELKGPLFDRFESHYLLSPIKREKVELARAFLDQGRRFITQTGSEVERASSREGWKLFPLLAGWRWRMGLAVLGSIILVVLAWLVLENSRRFRDTENQTVKNQEELRQAAEAELSRQPTKPQEAGTLESVKKDKPLSNNGGDEAKVSPPNTPRLATIVLSPQMRGVTEAPAVSIPSKAEYLGVRLELEPNDYSDYKVVLLSQTNGEILWRSGRVRGEKTDDGKVLVLRLPARLLKSRSYALQVSGLSETGVEERISDYPFRVAR
jgi:hypothetical protein